MIEEAPTPIRALGGSAAKRHFLAFPRELAVHDWLVLAFIIALNVAAFFFARDGRARTGCRELVLGMLVVLLLALVLVRGRVLQHRASAARLYRAGLYGGVQASYFLLGFLLPLLTEQTWDHRLHELDLALFGFEPAVVMDGWVTPALTEWFAFFYYTYFFILILHILPILFGSRHHRILGEFSLGMLMVFCLGHVGYMLVPGYGPYRELAAEFHNQLPSGFWLDMVMKTVSSAGSQLDIFPSMHTAAPTFITLFSFRNRHFVPYRYTWPLLAFVTVNIILATMYLRWHYVIDVLVGVLLAFAASLVSARVTRWELDRRRRHARTENWPLFSRAPN